MPCRGPVLPQRGGARGGIGSLGTVGSSSKSVVAFGSGSKSVVAFGSGSKSVVAFGSGSKSMVVSPGEGGGGLRAALRSAVLCCTLPPWPSLGLRIWVE